MHRFAAYFQQVSLNLMPTNALFVLTAFEVVNFHLFFSLVSQRKSFFCSDQLTCYDSVRISQERVRLLCVE